MAILLCFSPISFPFSPRGRFVLQTETISGKFIIYFDSVVSAFLFISCHFSPPLGSVCCLCFKLLSSVFCSSSGCGFSGKRETARSLYQRHLVWRFVRTFCIQDTSGGAFHLAKIFGLKFRKSSKWKGFFPLVPNLQSHW